MKILKRKTLNPSEEDKLQIRILRQQVEANEANYMLNQITEQEYTATLSRLESQLAVLEEKYGIEGRHYR